MNNKSPAIKYKKSRYHTEFDEHTHDKEANVNKNVFMELSNSRVKLSLPTI